MSPAVEWLEALTDDERLSLFCPIYPFDGTLFTLKSDQDRCRECFSAESVPWNREG